MSVPTRTEILFALSRWGGLFFTTYVPMKRTHHCAQLSPSDLGASVSLVGWVDTIRDQGGIIFVDLRDRRGITQIKLEPRDNAKLAEQLKLLKPESVIGITGRVAARPAGTENTGLSTGGIEVEASELEIHNISDTPPFPLDDAGGDRVNEDLRLTHRYLDLRRPKMRRNLEVRHRAAKSIPSTWSRAITASTRPSDSSDLRTSLMRPPELARRLRSVSVLCARCTDLTTPYGPGTAPSNR